MKYWLLIILLAVTLYSCKNEPSIEEQMHPKTTVCYTSIAGKDTAWLRVDTGQRRFLGFFEVNYSAKKQRCMGIIKGLESGDTIKGYWDFKVNNIDKWHRNPVAFLKKKDGVVLGVGKIVMVWGGGHFDGKVPINYDRGKFVFDVGVCKF